MPERALTVADYGQAYRTGSLTPTGMVSDVLARIAAHDDPAVFTTVCGADDLLRQAAALEAQGPRGLPLYGVPVAVKDNIDVAGLPTTCACPDFAYRPDRDAEAVARLRAAGALIVGKTNLDQFATGLAGVRSPYGVPRNAIRPGLVPGGSSSGSAVAVAAGLVPAALGTDTAGSGRVPAGLNNVVGLKPTLGAVSTRGVVPACRTLDCVSVFALTVADACAVLQAVAGFDPADPFSRRTGLGGPGGLPPGLRVGVPDGPSRRFGGDEAAEAAFDAAMSDLAKSGARIVPVDLSPHFAAGSLLYDGPWVAERYAAIRPFLEAQPEAFHPVTRAIIEGARRHSAADAFAAQYRMAELKRAAEGAWTGMDVLAVPTYPRQRTLDDLRADPVGANAELGTYTNFVNLFDLCAIAVPGRFRRDGGPAGVTLIAPAGRDALVAALGAQLHAAAGVPLGATGARLAAPAPPGSAPAPPGSAQVRADEVELAVVGAHMSGMPLNPELTGRGGRLLREARTCEEYRLFALAGGPPRRPGLLRVGRGGGGAIMVEVWSMPLTGFGGFVAGVPPPLAIGTVRLGDGTAPKGFLVEAEATHDAQDITSCGGWRAYINGPPPGFEPEQVPRGGA